MTFDIFAFLESLIQLTTFEYMREVWADDMSSGLAEIILDVVAILVISTFCLLIVLILIWLERKLISRFQDRIGPNRVGGRYGLLQSVADAIKLLSKEIITPSGADKLAYNLAPLLIVMAALLVWAVIPFAPGVIGVNLNVGVFYVLAISSVSVVTLLLAGWGSNNKYALLGAFRSVAQLVSYEVPMVMALLIPVLLAGSMSTQRIVAEQNIWYIFVIPLSALIFFISALAELGRTPFDLLEAESEIIAGFHTEYSGMKFAMFMLAEFVSALFMASLFTTIYLGGWRGPGAVEFPILGFIYFFLKTFVVFFFFVWVRGTLPRIRIDQLLNFNWKVLVPLTLVLLMVVAVVVKILPEDISEWGAALILLATNVIIGLITLDILRRRGRQSRIAAEEGRLSADQSAESLESETAPVAVH
jgi:NADH-quinone oxidoreductase subunit H